MKNITNIEKTAIGKTAIDNSKDNSKNNNNCLAVFFGIIHFDDELKSPSGAGQQQIWFLRWVCVFAGLSGRQQQKYFWIHCYYILRSNWHFRHH